MSIILENFSHGKKMSNDRISGAVNSSKTKLFVEILSVDEDLKVLIEMIDKLVENSYKRFDTITHGVIFFKSNGMMAKKNEKGEIMYDDEGYQVMVHKPLCKNLYFKVEEMDGENKSIKIKGEKTTGPYAVEPTEGEFMQVPIEYFSKFVEVNLDRLIQGKVKPIALEDNNFVKKADEDDVDQRPWTLVANKSKMRAMKRDVIEKQLLKASIGTLA
jgi:hypothetical protein